MKEYKVLRSRGRGLKTDEQIAEKEINEYAKEGWRVVTCCPSINGDFADGLVIIMERDCK